MPHLTIEYTGNLDAHSDMQALCQRLAGALVALTDEAGAPVFPAAGTRVLAYPARYSAVMDGAPERCFVYLNLRITPGRSAQRIQAVGEALLAQTRAHFAALLSALPLRVTLHIDEGHPVYEGKLA